MAAAGEGVVETGEPSPDWHALTHEKVAAALGTSPHGLGSDEARCRLALHGPNVLEEARSPRAWAVLLHQFTSPLIAILLVAAVVMVALEEYLDAGVISVVLVLNASIGFVQERRAESAVRALMQLASPHARVVRDGREWDVEGREVVPGDLVLLSSGSRIPADVRLSSTTTLSIDESLLTGESAPVHKQAAPMDAPVPLADRASMAYTGTVVASGRGRGYVVATGGETELGRIAQTVREEERPQTPLQERMTRFARVIGIGVGVSASLAFGVGVGLGESPAEMFMVAVALAVSAIPEGLPVVFTITLALGVRRMARRNAIIRSLPAVETLGSTTAIGSDKTGTLTENRMTVTELWSGLRYVETPEPRGAHDVTVPEPSDPVALALTAGVLANEAEAYVARDGVETQGDPTEVALLLAAWGLGVDPVERRSAWTETAQIPFESERRYAASYRRSGEQHAVFVKGAPERVLEMCGKVLTDAGPATLDPEVVHEASRAMAGRGLRVLAVAYRELDAPPGGAEEHLEPEGMIFLGLFGMLDPPRAEVRDAVAGCRRAGIRVVMITGDHALTARSIADDLGILGEGGRVVTGAELDRLDDEALARAVDDTAVYARVSPAHKLRIVRALQEAGDVVAVTGDGVNDAPALKAADIGVAMGRGGTDVAREASDMVLADDNFASIYAAVEEGRVTFDNLRKVTFFLVSSGAAEVLMILGAIALGWPLPLLPAQILWLNLVTNGLQDVALAFEPAEPGVAERPPRARHEGVLSRLLWERTVVAGVVMAAGSLLVFRYLLEQGVALEGARTAALTTMVVFQAFHAGNCRSEWRSVFRVPPLSNRFLFGAVAGAVAVHLAALQMPFTRFVLRVEPLPLGTWAQIAGVGLAVVIAVEFHKLVRRGRAGGRAPAASGGVA